MGLNTGIKGQIPSLSEESLVATETWSWGEAIWGKVQVVNQQKVRLCECSV